jgi:ABC-2 type transport system ATP-binding protein
LPNNSRPNTNAILEFQGVSKHYGRYLALDNIGLSVTPGVTGLLGPNGSGKSTLIKAILGLVKIDTGTGRVLGYPWPQQTRVIRDKVGYLPEDDCYILGLQGIESVQMMARLSGLEKTEALRRAHEVLDFCDVGQERYRNVETYSTGMRQKLKFAQAIVHDPPMIILDEPTTGLDPAQREEFLDRIATLAKVHGKSVILSTHILHDVQQVCDSVVILARGRVRLADTLSNLQRPSQAGLHLHVIDHAARLATELERLGFQSNATTAQELKVWGMGDRSRSEIWRASGQCGVLIQRMEEAKTSLEQTFLEIVSDVQHAHT